MRKYFDLIVILFLIITSCQKSPNLIAIPTDLQVMGFPKIDRNPTANYYHRGKKLDIPKYDPNSEELFQVDLRSYDLSALDLRNSLTDLLYADFNSRTIWPSADKLPLAFDRELIMQLGKNPGLSIHQLHNQGITGKDIGIAIIDQPLLTGHLEYAGRLQLYEEINIHPNAPASMHGAAVASIVVGQNVGVAPGANLFFIACSFTEAKPGGNGDILTFQYAEQAVRRIIEINKILPDTKKIKVISMSFGWEGWEAGYADLIAAIDAAKAAGLFVMNVESEEIYGFKFHGLGRFPCADPDNFESYSPGAFWANRFYKGFRQTDRLLIPMDSRTTASESGATDYVFYRTAGWSWAVPYIAGVYALAVQVDPTITPGRFWSLAMSTGQTINIHYKGESIPFGPILDPVVLINSL